MPDEWGPREAHLLAPAARETFLGSGVAPTRRTRAEMPGLQLMPTLPGTRAMRRSPGRSPGGSPGGAVSPVGSDAALYDEALKAVGRQPRVANGVHEPDSEEGGFVWKEPEPQPEPEPEPQPERPKTKTKQKWTLFGKR